MLWKSDQNIGGAATPTQLWSQPLERGRAHPHRATEPAHGARRGLARDHRRGTTDGRGRPRRTGSSTRGTGSTNPPTRSVRRAVQDPPVPARTPRPCPCSAPTPRASGQESRRSSRTHPGSGSSTALRTLSHRNPTSRRDRSSSRGSGCSPRGPTSRRGSRLRASASSTARRSGQAPRRRASSAATALPSACPWVAFITCPVKKPVSLSPPPSR